LQAGNKKVVWAPEFFKFPDWARNADLMFADGAGWDRPIRFVGGVGGHAAALSVARDAHSRGVRKLILAHIGRPTIRAIDDGKTLPFGEFGVENKTYRLRAEATRK
jgi:ribonuclease BN (tRNA processing enzyme)